MSLIVDLGKNKENLVKIIVKYTNDLDSAKSELEIAGKTI